MMRAVPEAGSPRIVQLHWSGPTGKVSWMRSVLPIAPADNLSPHVNRVLTSLALVLLAAGAFAQAGDSGTKVRVKRAVREQEFVVLDLRIEPVWHIYAVNAEGSVGNATKVNVDRPFEIAGTITEPKPQHHTKDYRDPDTKEVIYTEEYDSH